MSDLACKWERNVVRDCLTGNLAATFRLHQPQPAHTVQSSDPQLACPQR